MPSIRNRPCFCLSEDFSRSLTSSFTRGFCKLTMGSFMAKEGGSVMEGDQRSIVGTENSRFGKLRKIRAAFSAAGSTGGSRFRLEHSRHDTANVKQGRHEEDPHDNYLNVHV